MRLWPNSIAGRTILVLVTGLIATFAASISILSMDRFRDANPGHYWAQLGQIATLAAIVERTPPRLRRDLLPALTQVDIRAQWSPAHKPSAMASPRWFSKHLARDLHEALQHTGFGPWSLVKVAPAGQHNWDVWIRLKDQSWLQLTIDRERVGSYWLLRLLLAVAVLGGGIAVLAIWAGHKVTRPIDRFAAAAERLGTNVDTPPLEESGTREIQQAAAAFNRMQGRVQRLIEDRTQTLAAISHDLRTGLTRLKLRSDFIDDPEQQRKAQVDLDEMESILDSTLSFARDDPLSEAPSKLDLASLLKSLCDDRHDTGHIANYHGPAHIPFDGRPVAMRRAFTNLIDNAIRYGGEADVTLEPQTNHIVVTICDHGPGIPEDKQAQVFNPFFRLEASRSRKTGGTGLGLTIARAAIRSHGGDIRLFNRPGGGLQVKVELPLS